MTTPEQHQLKIARDTMKLSCIGTKILGGMNHCKAVEVIKALTSWTRGNRVYIEDDCTCEDA